MSIAPVDLLVHGSNLLLLVSYSVRDVLWLRWFAVAAAVTVIPYYLVQPTILWPPILWGGVFTAINLFQIGRIYAERRPVVLSPDERALYAHGFSGLRPREFVSLVLAGEWRDAARGDALIKEGENVTAIGIAIAGAVDVDRKGERLAVLSPGHVIGTGIALSGGVSPVTAKFAEGGRYIRWPVPELRAFLDKRPEMRAVLRDLVSRDLARKLETSFTLPPG